MVARKIDESNVENYIEELKQRTNGKYINQGVAFNKDCRRQMELLKLALLHSSSFSGLVKEMLAVRFQDNNGIQKEPSFDIPNITEVSSLKDQTKNDYSSWV